MRTPRVFVAGCVQRGEHAAQAVAHQGDLLVAARLSRRGQRARQVPVDVALEVVVGVELVRDSPVEHEHVEAGAREVLDRAVARAQVEDVAPADQAVHDDHRRPVPAITSLVAPELRLVAPPYHVLRGRTDGRRVGAAHVADPVASAQDRALDVTVESRDRSPGLIAEGKRGFISPPSADSARPSPRRREKAGSAGAPCAPAAGGSGECPSPAGRFSRCRQRRETPSAVPSTFRRTRVVVLIRSKYVSERTADSIGSPMARSSRSTARSHSG